MGALAQLSQSRVEVEPGRTATVAVTVRNNGTVVDRYTFEALGAGRPVGDVQLRFAVVVPRGVGHRQHHPRPPSPADGARRPHPFGGPDHLGRGPDGSVVEEGDRRCRGLQRHHARAGAPGDERPDHRPDPAGRGQPFELQLSGQSRGHRPANGAAVQVPSARSWMSRPGNAEFVKVAIRPSNRFWKGSRADSAFRLILRDEQADARPGRGAGRTRPPAGIAGVESATRTRREDGPAGTARGPGGHGAGWFGRPGDRRRTARRRPAPAPDGSARPTGAGPAAVPAAGAAAAGGPDRSGGAGRRARTRRRSSPTGRCCRNHAPAVAPRRHRRPGGPGGTAGDPVVYPVQTADQSTAQNEVNKQLAANGITPVTRLEVGLRRRERVVRRGRREWGIAGDHGARRR